VTLRAKRLGHQGGRAVHPGLRVDGTDGPADVLADLRRGLAGIQVVNTAQFPVDAGPLSHVHR
jgi:hypothetical protein